MPLTDSIFNAWRFQAATLLALVVVAAGCDRGPQRYSVSGELLYDGKTVPNGLLVFTPDHTAGNSGPQGVAHIKDGKIVTQKDRKVVGGPHWVQIMAFDGIPYQGAEGLVEHGRPLIPLVQAPVDLPKADANVKIRVAKSKAEPKVEITVE